MTRIFSKSNIKRHEHRDFCILYLSELGRHQLVKLGIAGRGNLLTNGTRELKVGDIKVDKHPYGSLSPLIFP